MIWIFLAAAIFGGAFLIPMVLGGLDSDLGDGIGGELGDGADISVDPDIVDAGDVGDVDTDSEPDAISDGAAVESGTDALGAIAASILSFRTVVFFSAFFGASGLVFSALDYSITVSLVAAAFIGGAAAFANSVVFGLVKSSQSTSQITDRTLEGRRAKVTLPIEVGKRGRIKIDLGGQPQFIVARPYDDRSQQQFDVGASVVVVKIENGTALVASLAELDLGEES